MSRLHAFTDESAVRFHSEAIRKLRELSLKPEAARDENLLAAVILLRWYEVVDGPLRNDDQESDLFLHLAKVFITEQFVRSPGACQTPSSMSYESTSTTIHTDIDASTPSTTCSLQLKNQSDGVRQASFWVAIRQEIYDCFLTQRSFKFPLSSCSEFRSFAVTDDTTWASRLVVFCADCMEFCYGSTEIFNGCRMVPSLVVSSPAYSIDRWNALKERETRLTEALPPSFEPIYSFNPDSHAHGIFPEFWYLHACHVTGLQHLELARIALLVHDPTRPRLGPGSMMSMRSLSTLIKERVIRLCGMALGNRRFPPTIATACLGIAMCGDHFEKRREQEALLSMLSLLQDEHGWPFPNTVERLKLAWGWDE